jgi:transcriptional regulator with XRE-family HTH domain
MARKLGPIDEAAAAQFAQELTRLRMLNDLSQRELGRRTGTSGQQIGAIERGERSPSKQFAELADKALHATGSLLNLWPGNRTTSLRWLQKYVDLEAKALFINQFQVQVIPALLQTEAYARATLEAAIPPRSTQAADELLQSRMARQKLLSREHPPMVHYVVDEGALKRVIGGQGVMRAQLEQVIERVTTNPFVSLQVLPHDRGAHAGLDGTFTLLGMSLAESLVYVETVAPGQVHTDPQVVSDATHQFGALRTLALSPVESVQLISSIKEGL